MNWLDEIHVGDCRQLMRSMIADGVKVNCVVTSPPYYALRDYGVAGQLGLEGSLGEFIATMVDVFELVRELLADDGTLWLNMGDSYALGGRGGNSRRASSTLQGGKETQEASQVKRHTAIPDGLKADGLKAKDLMGQPWRLAFALQDAGWYLRRDIIWHKPNPMPESVKDRPTTAHEYIFLMSKAPRYHYDAAAIAEPVSGTAHARGSGVNPKANNGVGWGYGEEEVKARTRPMPPIGVAPGPRARPQGPKVAGWAHGEGVSHSAKDHARAQAGYKNGPKFGRGAPPRAKQNASFSAAVKDLVETRNARSVWTIPTEPFPGAHFATFPRELPRRCILAGSRPGDVVFDPFMGSGTVAEVALELGRHFIGTELNPEYAAMFRAHRSQQKGLGL